MESKLLETIGIDPGIILIAIVCFNNYIVFYCNPHQYEIQSFKSQLYNVYAWKEW